MEKVLICLFVVIFSAIDVRSHEYHSSIHYTNQFSHFGGNSPPHFNSNHQQQNNRRLLHANAAPSRRLTTSSQNDIHDNTNLNQSSVPTSPDHLLQYYVHKTMSSAPHDLVYSTDHMKFTFPMVCINYKQMGWPTFRYSLQYNCSTQSKYPAVIVTFNELIGDIFLSIHNYRKKHSFEHALNELSIPIVVLAFYDQNWGFLSTIIPNRTASTINLTNHLRIHKSDYSTITKFLDSPKIVALFVNAHVDPLIPRHDKLISIPLGVPGLHSYKKILALSGYANKTRLLLINNSGWKFRQSINNFIIRAFNYTIVNEYNIKNSGGPNVWRNQIRSSKFVLCPSGFSFDTFRVWETLLMGSIPIVETNPSGLDRTLSTLPVLIVPSFTMITPEFLEKAYECFVSHAHQWNYNLLKGSYWRELAMETMRSGNIETIKKNHPFYNQYCNYLTN